MGHSPSFEGCLQIVFSGGVFSEQGTSTPGHLPVYALGLVECKKFVPPLLAQTLWPSNFVTFTAWILDIRPDPHYILVSGVHPSSRSILPASAKQ